MLFKISSFVHDIYLKREIILELSKRDFKQQYMGSYLGFIWVFLQPLLFISVLYIVFTFGFRKGIEDSTVPFSLYLISGIIAWQFFAMNLSAGSNVIKQYSFLLKKVDFRLSILPIVKLLSSFIPHVFFILVAIIIAWMNGFAPSLYTLQIGYYFFSMIILLLGLGWLTSSTNIFVKDVSNIVSIFVQFGFWMTPIFWNIKMVPEQYIWIVKLNPMYYIVAGYRDSLIHNIAFWEKPFEMAYFWIITLIILLSGITVFNKLRPHFAEVI